MHWCTLWNDWNVCVQFMQEEVGLWSPDVFRLDIISADNSLVCAAYNIFKTRQFSCLFKISPPTFINFILAIQVLYVYMHTYIHKMLVCECCLLVLFDYTVLHYL